MVLVLGSDWVSVNVVYTDNTNLYYFQNILKTSLKRTQETLNLAAHLV